MLTLDKDTIHEGTRRGRTFPSLVTLAVACGLAAGCERDRTTDAGEISPPREDTPPGVETAKAVERMTSTSDETRPEAVSDLDPTAGLSAPVDGRARLWSTTDGVKLVLELTNAPVGARGVHVHAASSCDDLPRGKGDHFAPEGDLHALPQEADAKQRHLGDLGNVAIGVDGKGRLEIELPGASLDPGHPQSLIGKPLALSAGEDHGQSRQPAGDSGAAIACGVIRDESLPASGETPG
jgi:Cu-Zn family superoxide dismutase